MNLIEFPEQTVIIAKDQPEYRNLPAHVVKDDQRGKIIFCWELTWKERFKIIWTGLIWHSVLTFNDSLQPQLLMTDKPQMKKAD